jgi:hypothetical protein
MYTNNFFTIFVFGLPRDLLSRYFLPFESHCPCYWIPGFRSGGGGVQHGFILICYINVTIDVQHDRWIFFLTSHYFHESAYEIDKRIEERSLWRCSRWLEYKVCMRSRSVDMAIWKSIERGRNNIREPTERGLLKTLYTIISRENCRNPFWRVYNARNRFV